MEEKEEVIMITIIMILCYQLFTTSTLHSHSGCYHIFAFMLIFFFAEFSIFLVFSTVFNYLLPPLQYLFSFPAILNLHRSQWRWRWHCSEISHTPARTSCQATFLKLEFNLFYCLLRNRFDCSNNKISKKIVMIFIFECVYCTCGWYESHRTTQINNNNDNGIGVFSKREIIKFIILPLSSIVSSILFDRHYNHKIYGWRASEKKNWWRSQFFLVYKCTI